MNPLIVFFLGVINASVFKRMYFLKAMLSFLFHCNTTVSAKTSFNTSNLKREKDVGHGKRIDIETKFPQLELLAVFRKRKHRQRLFFYEATNF